ncbi:MAG: ABC transporter permease [Candidatus Krumholzibacteriota bacterium]|nr:ABC transporter permease [Candidatus Krumholzibacteriota bacterium]
MRKFAAIYRRELMYYFQSVTAYVTISIFLILSGYFFFSIFRYYNLISLQSIQNNTFSGNLNLIDGVIRPLMGNISIILLLLLPLLTMRLLAEEKKLGTFELLLTYPVPDITAVTGKFLSALTVYLIMLSGTFLYPVILMIYSEPEIPPILSCYLGLFLMGCSFISMGLFFSSLTSNQLVAGVATFGLSLFFLVIGWAAPFVGNTTSTILAQFSLLIHFDSFSKGVIDTQDITYYLLLTIFFIFLTLRSLESTRWRN